MIRLALLALALPLTGCVFDAGPAPVRNARSRPAPGPDRGSGSLDDSPDGAAAFAPPSDPIPFVGDPDDPTSTVKEALVLDDVLGSVQRHFPLLLAAQAEYDIARARERSARGAFDLRLEASGLADIQGFYESERLGVRFVQPVGPGGVDVVGGYRIGRGDFATYDGKARTNTDGEFEVGLRVPLLRGRSVDKRRVAVWRAQLGQERAEPAVRRVVLRGRLDASVAYWKWVGAGRKLEIAQGLLRLAEDRNDQLQLAVEEGELAPITLTDNERSIVARRAKLYDAERAFQEAAITLSLYLRDEEGRPRIATVTSLPPTFPDVRPLDQVLVADSGPRALRDRPEVRTVDLGLQDIDLRLDLARNDVLPDLDVGVFASQDVGDPTSTVDDKSPFEFSAGVRLSVPLQRNAAKGRVEELEARRRRLVKEQQFLQERILADVQDAESALRQSWAQLAQAARNVVLADELARAEVVQVLAGESDLFRLNLREQQAALAGEANVQVLQEHFQALARYQAVLGGDPRDGQQPGAPPPAVPEEDA